MYVVGVPPHLVVAVELVVQVGSLAMVVVTEQVTMVYVVAVPDTVVSVKLVLQLFVAMGSPMLTDVGTTVGEETSP